MPLAEDRTVQKRAAEGRGPEGRWPACPWPLASGGPLRARLREALTPRSALSVSAKGPSAAEAARAAPPPVEVLAMRAVPASLRDLALALEPLPLALALGVALSLCVALALHPSASCSESLTDVGFFWLSPRSRKTKTLDAPDRKWLPLLVHVAKRESADWGPGCVKAAFASAPALSADTLLAVSADTPLAESADTPLAIPASVHWSVRGSVAIKTQ